MKHLKVDFEALKNMDMATREIIKIQKNSLALQETIKQAYRNSGRFGCADMTTELENVKTKAGKECGPFTILIELAYKNFCAAIDDASIPDGSTINANDAALMANNLVRQTELSALQRRHANNTAMLRMIEDYADRHGWEGFKDLSHTDAHYIREFATERHQMARSVADHFHGEQPNYNASYFEKHINPEEDYNAWLADNSQLLG